MFIKNSRFLVLMLAFVLIFSSIAFAAPNEKAAAAFDKKLLTKLDINEAVKHVEYLTEVIGVRVAGTEKELEAAEYIKGVLQEYGYDNAELQAFEYEDSPYVALNIDSLGDLSPRAAGMSGYTSAEGLTAKVVDCGLGNSMDEFPKDPVTGEYLVKGNFALIQRGVAPFVLKTQNALQAGAAGIILYNNLPGTVNPAIGDTRLSIPFVVLTLDNGNLIKEKVAIGETSATIVVEQVITTSQNVVAVKPPTNKKSSGIIYVTAHYDTVPGAPGANDNASGTAMLLEFARILKHLPTEKEVRFIACGAEEVGLWGSRRYVEQLNEDDRSRSVANFNMDMIASDYPGLDILEVNTVDGEHNDVSLAAVAAGARLGDLNRIEAEYGISSDHRYFGQMLQIPHGGFIWVNENGGLEPDYHMPTDTIADNFSVERFDRAGTIIGSALYELLRKQTPNLTNSAIREARPFLGKVQQE